MIPITIKMSETLRDVIYKPIFSIIVIISEIKTFPSLSESTRSKSTFKACLSGILYFNNYSLVFTHVSFFNFGVRFTTDSLDDVTQPIIKAELINLII